MNRRYTLRLLHRLRETRISYVLSSLICDDTARIAVLHEPSGSANLPGYVIVGKALTTGSLGMSIAMLESWFSILWPLFEVNRGSVVSRIPFSLPIPSVERLLLVTVYRHNSQSNFSRNGEENKP